jgi:SAM-dependent methyltransferase
MDKSDWGTDEEIWQTISPPLIPAPEDIELLRLASLPALAAAGETPRVLVLGVTPALVAAPWLAQCELHAVDYDQVMIDLLWTAREGAECHRAFWQAMPFPDAHFDLVLGDCSFNALVGLATYDEVLREIARVRRPGAPLAARFFMQSEPRLTLPGLLRDRAAFDTWNSTAKRLAVAIAASEDDGSLNLSEIPRRIADQGSNVDNYLAALGQTEREIARAKKTYEIEQYLNYPGQARIIEKFSPHFPRISFAQPAYDCGAYCPTVTCA